MALYLGKNKVVKGNYKGSSGELDTSDATAVESNVIEGKTFYANGEKKVGTMGQWDGSSTSNSLSYSSGDIYIQSDGVSGGYIQAGASYRQKLTDPGSLGDAVASDVVKGKTFTSASGIKLEGTKEESEDIKLQEKTVSPSTSSQVITPDSGYGGLSKVNVNAMTTVSKATPSISVSSSGLITASATQPAGYVTSGTTSNTKQLSTQSGKTITPSTSQQVAVSSGVYTTDNIYVSGDTNLTSSNIKSGVSIFGVSGSYSGGGSMRTITATATNQNGAGYAQVYFEASWLDMTTIDNFIVWYFNSGTEAIDSTYGLTNFIYDGGSLSQVMTVMSTNKGYYYTYPLPSTFQSNITVEKYTNSLYIKFSASASGLMQFFTSGLYYLNFIA